MLLANDGDLSVASDAVQKGRSIEPISIVALTFSWRYCAQYLPEARQMCAFFINPLDGRADACHR